MNATKIILFLLGASFGALALLGAFSIYRDYPRFAIAAAAVLTVLFILASFSARRSRRELAAAEAVLAGLACPVCGVLFGREAASTAIHPPRLPNVKYMIEDDFGYSTVTCPNCGTLSSFHRLTHELVLLQQPNVADGPSRD